MTQTCAILYCLEFSPIDCMDAVSYIHVGACVEAESLQSFMKAFIDHSGFRTDFSDYLAAWTNESAHPWHSLPKGRKPRILETNWRPAKASKIQDIPIFGILSLGRLSKALSPAQALSLGAHLQSRASRLYEQRIGPLLWANHDAATNSHLGKAFSSAWHNSAPVSGLDWIASETERAQLLRASSEACHPGSAHATRL